MKIPNGTVPFILVDAFEYNKLFIRDSILTSFKMAPIECSSFF